MRSSAKNYVSNTARYLTLIPLIAISILLSGSAQAQTLAANCEVTSPTHHQEFTAVQPGVPSGQLKVAVTCSYKADVIVTGNASAEYFMTYNWDMKLDDNNPGGRTLHSFYFSDRVVLGTDGMYSNIKSPSTGTSTEQCATGFHKITVGCYATLYSLGTFGDPPIYVYDKYISGKHSGDRNDFVVHPPVPNTPIPLNWPP